MSYYTLPWNKKKIVLYNLIDVRSVYGATKKSVG